MFQQRSLGGWAGWPDMPAIPLPENKQIRTWCYVTTDVALKGNVNPHLANFC